MFHCICLLIYCILCDTASPRTIDFSIPETYKLDNFALEIALEDNTKNKQPDTESSDNIQTDNDIDDKAINFRANNIETFTDFIQTLINTLNNFDDNDIDNFFETFNDEVGKYHYNGCKFYELTDNEPFKQFIASKFEEYKNIPPAIKKQRILNIVNLIDESKYNKHEKDLIDFINSLYKQDSIDKFNKFLNKINDYRLKTKEIDLAKVVRDGMRSIIFNHYTKLDYNTRAALKSKLDQYWARVLHAPSLRSQLNAAHLLDHRNEDKDTFQFPNKHIDKPKPKHFVTKPNVKTFMTLYPKFVLNWKILSSPKVNHFDVTKMKSKYKKYDGDYSLEKTTMYNSDINRGDRYDKDILRHVSDDSNDESSNFWKTEAEGKTDATAATDPSSEVESDHDVIKEQLETTERAVIRNRPKAKKMITKKTYQRDTTGNIVIESKPYVKKQAHKRKKIKKVAIEHVLARTPITDNMIKAEHQPYIEVITMKPFIPKRIEKRIKYDINLKRASNQPRSRDHIEVQHASSHEDSFINDEGLSIEEIKEKDKHIYRRNNNNQIPADTVVIGKDVLARLQELENELINVKSLANNDTEMINRLKNNIQLGMKNGKASGEYVMGKVIPCENKENDMNINKGISYRHNYDSERDVMPKVNSLKYIRNTHHNFESREDKNDNGKHTVESNEELHTKDKYFRRSMMNKVVEIKNKFDGAVHNDHNRRNIAFKSNAKIDFDKEYIPDKDIFNKNMRKLKKYLDSNNNKHENNDYVRSNDMSNNEELRTLSKYNENVPALDKRQNRYREYDM